MIDKDKLAENWLKEQYFDKENGDWYHYDMFKAMQEYAEVYHKAKLAEVTDEDIETEAGLRFENVLKPTIAKHKFEAFIIGAKAFRESEIKHIYKS